MTIIDMLTPIALEWGVLLTAFIFFMWLLARGPFAFRIHFVGYASLGEPNENVDKD